VNRPDIVPYITMWSGEVDGAQAMPIHLYHHADERFPRVGFRDESVHDRDSHGVLWQRVPLAQGTGRPQFASVHALRQRRAMTRKLCQVCAAPADHTTPGGWLWVLTPHEATLLDQGAQSITVGSPPVCAACAVTARRLCPHLRDGSRLIRAARVRPWGVMGLDPRDRHRRTAAYTDPRIHLIVAGQQLVELSGIITLE
jgi:hypothetical protein